MSNCIIPRYCANSAALDQAGLLFICIGYWDLNCIGNVFFKELQLSMCCLWSIKETFVYCFIIKKTNPNRELSLSIAPLKTS